MKDGQEWIMRLTLDNETMTANVDRVGELIRCKECKHWDGYFCHNKWWGDGHGNYTPPIKTEEGYCDWAERKDECLSAKH